MTHIMVPDGVLPLWLWVPGWMVAVAVIGLALRATQTTDRARLVPLAGAMAAVMTIVMSLEIVPLAYEPHLTVLAGILLGPAYGFLATFVFLALRMLLGDGSVTLLGLNSLLLGVETVGGFYVFRALHGLWPSVRAPTQSEEGLAPAEVQALQRPLPSGRKSALAAAVATVVALACSTLLFLGVVGLGVADLDQVDLAADVFERAGLDQAGFLLFARLVLVLGAMGWLLEAILIGAAVAFLRVARPNLIFESRAE